MNNNVASLVEYKTHHEEVITRMVFTSNRLEGNSLTYRQTYTILFDNENSLTALTQNIKLREISEALNLKNAIMYMIHKLQNENYSISENDIIEINKIINTNILPIYGYREVGVRIKGANHLPPSPSVIRNQMHHCIENMNYSINSTIDIYYEIAKSRITFERIHPFQDGNGRTGRLLLNWILLCNDLPMAIIPADDENRNKYLNYLDIVDIEGFAVYIKDLINQEYKLIEKYIEIDKYEFKGI